MTKRNGMELTSELVGDKLVGCLDPPHVLHVVVQREEILKCF